jgi:hypothetical protein
MISGAPGDYSSSISNVDRFYGLSILVCHFGFLWRVTATKIVDVLTLK